MQKSKIAIIGTGASAFGALSTLQYANRNFKLDVFDIGDSSFPSGIESIDYRQWSVDDFDTIHHDIREAAGRKFPPPVSYFGTVPPTQRIGPKRTLLRSAGPGGLTKYWSASMLPFTQSDLEGWNLSLNDLHPYYVKISKSVGIAGRQDPIDHYFGESFVTRPSIQATDTCLKLIDSVNRNSNGSDFQLYAGVNRLAVETRVDHSQSCVTCGGCFYGCFKGAIFDGSTRIRKLENTLDFSQVSAKVTRIGSASNGKVTIYTENDQFPGYDKVFCAAGCIGTAEIMLRSLQGDQTAVDFVDNDLFFFPILYTGRQEISDLSAYVAISNAVIGYVPTLPGDRYAEVHIAPVSDWLLRYYLPARMWPLIRWLARSLRARVLLGSLFIHSDTSPMLQAYLGSGNEVGFRQIREGSSRKYAKTVASAIGNTIRSSGFILPTSTMISASTSVHYAGGFQPGAGAVTAKSNGELLPNVHLIDSSIFSASPAQPLTFSIMANAARIVTEILCD